MNCPACKDTVLSMTERQGIEIDYCPSCRGVWLDRGELDKIIEKSVVAEAPAARVGENPAYPPSSPSPDRYYKDQHKYKRKKSLLERAIEFPLNSFFSLKKLRFSFRF